VEMAKLYPIPEVAAGATEAVVSEWLLAPGDHYKAGDPLAVIETEKAVVEVQADEDAVLLRTLVAAGETVEVGSPMALLGSAAELDADLDAILAGLGVGSATVAAPAWVVEEVTEAPAPTTSPTGDPAPGHRVFASPLARRLLKEAGLPVESVTGTEQASIRAG